MITLSLADIKSYGIWIKFSRLQVYKKYGLPFRIAL